MYYRRIILFIADEHVTLNEYISKTTTGVTRGSATLQKIMSHLISRAEVIQSIYLYIIVYCGICDKTVVVGAARNSIDVVIECYMLRRFAFSKTINLSTSKLSKITFSAFVFLWHW